MLLELKIEELYGLYSYTIQFTENKNPLIVTAPNGFGKTTILRIIHNLYMGNLWYYYYLPFKCIKLSFDGNVSIIIDKSKIAELGDNFENYDLVIGHTDNEELVNELKGLQIIKEKNSTVK